MLIPQQVNDANSPNNGVRIYTIDAKAYIDKKTVKDLQEEQKQLVSRDIASMAKTEKELEEMERLKTRQMYRKMNSLRFYMALGIGTVGVISYFVFRRYRRVSMRNSFLHLAAINIIKKDATVLKELGNNFNIMSQIRGAAIDNKADFEIDAYGAKKKVSFKIQGSLDPNTQKWNLERIYMITRDKKTMEVVKEERIL